jgi:hypothetical protein
LLDYNNNSYKKKKKKRKERVILKETNIYIYTGGRDCGRQCSGVVGMEWTGKVSVHIKSYRFPYLAAFPVIILDFFLYIY